MHFFALYQGEDDDIWWNSHDEAEENRRDRKNNNNNVNTEEEEKRVVSSIPIAFDSDPIPLNKNHGNDLIDYAAHRNPWR